MNLLVKRKHFHFLFLTTLAFFISIQASIAQDDCGGVGQPPCQEEVPLDGGISLLLAAGAAYGVKKISEFRKDKEE